MTDINDQILQEMQQLKTFMAKMGVHVELPPASNKTFGIRFTAFEKAKMLQAEIDFNPNFTNPLAMFQGGMLCGAIDEVFGPLSYMVAGRPAVTIEMSTSFIRPFTAKDRFIVVKGDLVSRTKSLIVLRGEVLSADGKLIATASNHSLILQDDQLR